MKLHPTGFSRSQGLFHDNRNKMRWMEWLIAIFFIVSLLIGSGIFIKASNAANLKIRNHGDVIFGDISTIPGSMRVLKQKQQQQSKEESSPVIYIESEDSCELKIKS